jgi:hypothetical protein
MLEGDQHPSSPAQRQAYPISLGRAVLETAPVVTSVSGFWMAAIAPSVFDQRFTTDPFPPGMNVYGKVSLSSVDTLFAGNSSDP